MEVKEEKIEFNHYLFRLYILFITYPQYSPANKFWEYYLYLIVVAPFFKLKK